MNFIGKIRDPLHDTIPFTAEERVIIDRPEFQRLRRIHQTAFIQYVFKTFKIIIVFSFLCFVLYMRFDSKFQIIFECICILFVLIYDSQFNKSGLNSQELKRIFKQVECFRIINAQHFAEYAMVNHFLLSYSCFHPHCKKK